MGKPQKPTTSIFKVEIRYTDPNKPDAWVNGFNIIPKTGGVGKEYTLNLAKRMVKSIHDSQYWRPGEFTLHILEHVIAEVKEVKV